MKKHAKKVIAKDMRREAQKEMRRVDSDLYRIFRLNRSKKQDGRDVLGCLRDRDGKLHFREMERRNVCNDRMEEFMNEVNEYDQRVEAKVVMGPIQGVSY